MVPEPRFGPAANSLPRLYSGGKPTRQRKRKISRPASKDTIIQQFAG
jgi:hypothetical protein